MKFKKIISSVILCGVLAGCASGEKSTADYTYDGYVSPMRTSVMWQGYPGSNNVEYTETGTYFMVEKAASWLLYTDHGSDTVIKLCGRPDCDHMGIECNSLFLDAESVCLYDGHLYVFNKNFPGPGGSLTQINLDGTDRKEIYNIDQFRLEEGYSLSIYEEIFNGVFTFLLQKTDKDGETVFRRYYYKLDGSMEKPMPEDECFDLLCDGEAIIGVSHGDKEGTYNYGIWEPEKGIIKELYTLSISPLYLSYAGVKAAYNLEDGVVVQYDQTESRKELFDTGLKGNYWMSCFPDFLVIREFRPYDGTDNFIKEPILYFFSWDGSDLGSVKIDYEHNIGLEDEVISGETEDRILLTDEVNFLPQYYINKSDLGTGNIEIHEYNKDNKLDLGTSGFSYNDGKIEWFEPKVSYG